MPPYHATAPRTDAASAFSACEQRISDCAYGERTFDACALSMPPCTTSRFWEEQEVCCPQACMDGYAQARRSGMTQMSALQAAYRTDGTCGP